MHYRYISELNIYIGLFFRGITLNKCTHPTKRSIQIFWPCLLPGARLMDWTSTGRMGWPSMVMMSSGWLSTDTEIGQLNDVTVYAMRSRCLLRAVTFRCDISPESCPQTPNINHREYLVRIIFKKNLEILNLGGILFSLAF